jgi:hypothetical protein
VKQGKPHEQAGCEAVQIYCMGALVADEAARNGLRDFARSLESSLAGLLSGLPREQQAAALSLSYEMALGGDTVATPRLRLVYSRD